MAERTVFLTGATGFLGKVVLEDLLRRREALGVGRVVTLVRASSAEVARRRLETEVLSSACFSSTPSEVLERIEPVAGDLLAPDCGIGEAERARLAERVTHVVHCAASIDFDLPLERAAAINVGGALHILELARALPGLAGYASVSTAYVTPCPEDGAPVAEELAPLPRSAEAILESIERGVVEEGALLRETRHPNTYTLTKCIAEHLLLERRGDLPLTLVRPSIISASRRHPFPGWIDSHAAFAGFVTLVGLGELRVVAARPEARIDVVPCDDVARRVVDAAFEGARNGAPRIRHAVAGRRGDFSVALSRQVMEEFFATRPVGRGPRLRHVGPAGPGFRLREWLWHRAPEWAARTTLRVSRRPTRVRALEKLSERRRQLNGAFPYFTHSTFDFRSSVPLEEPFDPVEYLRTVCAGVYRHLLRQDERDVAFAGRQHRAPRPDLAWALTQPRGRAAVRLAGWTLAKLMRRVTSRASVDVASFEEAFSRIEPGTAIAVAPTHRSYLDFLLLPLLAFTRPELGLDLPHIAADEQFARIPLLSPLARRCNAFFLRRGQGAEDKSLTQQVHGLVARGAPILFFPEGGRSRTREFLEPRRGLLRSLQATGRPVAVLPVAISYDRVPEEAAFARELAGGPRQRIELGALARWLGRVRRGEVDLGPIFVRCGAPLLMDLESNVRELARELLVELQGALAVTTYQLRCFLAHSPIEGADASWLAAAIERRGGQVITSRLRGEKSVSPIVELGMRQQWQHLFYPEAQEAFAGDPAVEELLATRPRARDHGVREADDPRVAALLEALFAPVRAAWAAERSSQASAVRT
jgi:fatty acyl-CoA reductase